MSRLALLLMLCVAACSTSAPPTEGTTSEALASAALPSMTRQHVRGDVYHYQLDLPVGASATAKVRVHRVVRERAPGVPVPSQHAVMLLHGDFANFVTDFVPTLGTPASSAPGLAPYLADKGIDVWGVDRRWTLAANDGQLGDFAQMNLDQELGDIGAALALARATRAVTDGDGGAIVLGGFSHGAELAYAYAAAKRPGISGLVALDMYYAVAPDAVHQNAIDNACASAAYENGQLAQQIYVQDSNIDYLIGPGAGDRSAPNDINTTYGMSNHDALLLAVGQTYYLAPLTPSYHLIAPVLADDGSVASLRVSSEDAASAWLAGAPPYQSMAEGAALDAIVCGQTARAPLANIHVPLLYLGAAGGVGEYGLYTTQQVSSKDVTAKVISLGATLSSAEDFGHGDLLFAADAPALAWSPLASWLAKH